MSLFNLKRATKVLATMKARHWKYCRSEIKQGRRPLSKIREDAASMISRAVCEALQPGTQCLSLGFRGEAYVVVRRWEIFDGATVKAATGNLYVEFDYRTDYHKLRSLVPIMYQGGLIGEAAWCGNLRHGTMYDGCTIRFTTKNPNFTRKVLAQVCIP